MQMFQSNPMIYEEDEPVRWEGEWNPALLKGSSHPMSHFKDWTVHNGNNGKGRGSLGKRRVRGTQSPSCGGGIEDNILRGGTWDLEMWEVLRAPGMRGMNGKQWHRRTGKWQCTGSLACRNWGGSGKQRVQPWRESEEWQGVCEIIGHGRIVPRSHGEM